MGQGFLPHEPDIHAPGFTEHAKELMRNALHKGQPTYTRKEIIACLNGLANRLECRVKSLREEAAAIEQELGFLRRLIQHTQKAQTT